MQKIDKILWSVSEKNSRQTRVLHRRLSGGVGDTSADTREFQKIAKNYMKMKELGDFLWGTIFFGGGGTQGALEVLGTKMT